MTSKDKKCQRCGEIFTPAKYANNVKYCSQYCRNKGYYEKRGGAKYQREYYNKIRKEDGLPKIQCMICGLMYRQVGTHIVQAHGITAREYRLEFGFDLKKGQLPEDYRELKANQSVICGGVENLKKGAKFRFKKGQKGVGLYTRSPQTIERLKKLKYTNLCQKKNSTTPKKKK